MVINYDAAVIGSGPNGFSAAITLAKAGLSVVLFEAKKTVGGGMRSMELTEPGYIHDVCSAIHPLAANSPFFRSLPLQQFGLEWIHPHSPLAHPLDDGTALILERSLEETAHSLHCDGKAYQKLFEPFVKNWEKLEKDVLSPFHFPSHPLHLARFGLLAFQSATGLSNRRFKGESARALFAGLAGHSMLPLERPLTAAFGLVLGVYGHLTGWPMARGGSQTISNALAGYFTSLGGQIVTGTSITNIDALDEMKLILCDLTPHQLVEIAGHRLPENYKQRLARFRYGPGVFKMDWALSDPIPWTAPECLKAATVHVGGTAHEIQRCESAVWNQQHPEHPFVILAQQTLFDPSRAPHGKHTAWGYCHVPNGSTVDMTAQIEQQIERFAPGFRACIVARSPKNTHAMQAYNPNYIGGDINGGVQDLSQLFSRPAGFINPYATPIKGLYLCSSSTPPGGGVHGMCGYHAAIEALNILAS